MLQDKLLENFRNELETNKDIEDIVIFGSAARTNFQKYNDIDMLLIFNNIANLETKPDSLKDLELRNKIEILPIINYNAGIKLNLISHNLFNYNAGISLFHVFYCRKQDLLINHPLIKNLNKDKISIKQCAN